MASKIANGLTKCYIAQAVSSKREDSKDATEFLSGQVGVVKEQLQKAERDVNDYKATNGGIISIDETKIYQEINLAKQKLYDLQLKRRHLEGLRFVSKKSTDPMRNRLAALQKRLEDLRVGYTDNHPEVIQVKGDIEAIKEEMKRNPAGVVPADDNGEPDSNEAEITAIKVTEEGLKRYIASNDAMLRRIPSAKESLARLELEKNNKKALYDQLAGRYGQSQFTKEMELQDKIPSLKLIDAAVVPKMPIGPNRAKYILMGIVAGLVGGVGVVLLLDQLDQSVKTVGMVKSVGVPVLALIPRIQDPRQVKVARRKELALYAVSATYFSMILLVLVLEVMRPLLIDSLVGRM